MFRLSKCKKLLAGLLCVGLLSSNMLVYADEGGGSVEQQLQTSISTTEDNGEKDLNTGEESVEEEDLNLQGDGSESEEDLGNKEVSLGGTTDSEEDITEEEDIWFNPDLELPEGYVLDSQYQRMQSRSVEDRILDTNTKVVTMRRSDYTIVFGPQRVGGHKYWLDDNTQVYCMEPLKKSPDPKDYAIEAVYDNNHLLTKICYYGYGGPGYDANSALFRLIDGVGDGVDDYFLTHFIAGYITDGHPEPYYKSPFMSLLGYKPSGASKNLSDLIHEGFKILEGMPAAPANARSMVFQGAADDMQGNPYGVQKMAFYAWQYEPPKEGTCELVKTSSNPSITNGNGAYSLEGAKYFVYKDQACTTQASGTPLVTNASGVSNSITLPAGNYWVKEYEAPKGFELDTVAHSVTVVSGQKATVRVQDVPKQGYVDVYKVSANPSITNGNSNYTLAGAVYGVYRDQACTDRVGTITTNADGWGRLTGLYAGRYYIKEISASTGYDLDLNVYPVDAYV